MELFLSSKKSNIIARGLLDYHQTEITEVNLSAFVYRLFHEDFFSIYGISSSLFSLEGLQVQDETDYKEVN